MISSLCPVTSLDQPELQLYRSLRRPVEHRRQGIFIAEGNKVVERFLASGHEVISVLLTDSWLDTLRQTLENRPEPIAVLRAPDKLIPSIVGFRYHQGIIAAGRVPLPVPLETLCTVTAPPHLFVGLDRLSSAENTGSIIRTSVACGAGALIAGEESSDPYLRRSVRNSMGAIFNLPVVYSSCLADSLAVLRDTMHFSIIAAHTGEGSTPLHSVDFRGNSCVILGNEDSGVSDRVLEQCTTVTKIPMAEGVDSFNVGCAAAIILHEAYRQRN